MSVRAKFKVTANNPIQGQEGAEQHDVLMDAVYDPEPGSDNHDFWKWTPAGQIRLSTVNPIAWQQLEVDKEYYVDFSPAE